MMRISIAIAALVATPAIAGPAMPLKPGKVITNAENLTSYRWVDAKDEADGLPGPFRC